MKLKDWMKANRHTDATFILEVNQQLAKRPSSHKASYTARAVKPWRDGTSVPRPQVIEAIHAITGGEVRYADHIAANAAFDRKIPLKGATA